MTQQENAMVRREQFSLQPTDFREAMEFARIMSSSDLVPKDYRGKQANVLVAVQMGAEVGLSPMQAIQNIAVINGRPALWGDAMLAVVRAHPKCGGVVETFDDATMTAQCLVRRSGEPDTVREFSRADAERAGLWSKPGPWSSYPKRMLQMRARGFALRDSFPDALRGLNSAEELGDIPPRGSGTVEPVKSIRSVEASLDESATVEAKPRESATVDAEFVYTGQSELPATLDCIAAASNLAELSACKARFASLTADERRQAIEAGIARKAVIEAEAFELAQAESERVQSEVVDEPGSPDA